MKRFAVLLLSLWVSAPAGAESLRVLALRSNSFFDEKGGRLGGIEYDILEFFAKARGLELDVRWAESFPELLSRVEKRDCDLAAGTITITPEREKRMDFAGPYFPVQIALAVRAEDQLKTIAELVGSRVGAFRSTTADDALKSIRGIEVSYGGTLEDMLKAVEHRELRAAAADSSSIIPALEEHAALKLGLMFGNEQNFGFALPKGSALKEPLSQHVLRLKESGIYFRILKQYLGPKATEIVRAAKSR